jgi:hypothetical protein
MAEPEHFLNIIKAIHSHLKAGWTTLPAILPNDDASGVTLTNGFVALDVNFDRSDFASINPYNSLIRTQGVFSFMIHSPVNTGIGTSLTYAGQIADLFRGKQLSSGKLVCYNCNVGQVGEKNYGNTRFFLTLVTLPFMYDSHVGSIL